MYRLIAILLLNVIKIYKFPVMSHDTSYTTNLLRSFEKILIVLNLDQFTVEKLKY